MNFKKTKLAISLSLLIIIPSLVYAQNESYEAGQKAMHSKNYEKAYQYFIKAESDKDYTDAALYWQAYVLYKNNKNAKAKRTIEKLFDNHPNSKWIDDAEFLVIEHDFEHNMPNMVELELELKKLKKLDSLNSLKNIELNEELRLFAIQQLMFKDQVKGLSLVKDMLNNSKDLQVKMNALQLMGINESAQATKELYDFIHKNKVEELQSQAIEMLSIRNSLQSQEMLLDLYKQKTDKVLKSAIIQGFIHSNDHKKILELIQIEKDPDLSEEMIHILGILGANEELKLISKSIIGEQNKAALLEALALSGDSQTIKDMIINSKDKDTKSRAIQSFIMLDNDDNTKYLLDLYQSEKDPRFKHDIISVFSATQIDSKEIVKLINSESNKDLKSQLIESLMIIEDKAALLKLHESEKDPQVKLQILQMLGIMGASNELKAMHKNSKNPEFQVKVIESLAIDDSENHEEFLNQAYQSGNPDVKNSVIQAYMIKENTQALVQLLKQEPDREIKKNILRTISMIDPEYILKSLENSNYNGEQK